MEGEAAVGHGARAKRWGDFEKEAPALSLYAGCQGTQQSRRRSSAGWREEGDERRVLFLGSSVSLQWF